MKNWAGNVTWKASEVAYPSTEAEIQELVLQAANSKKRIRMIGTGHSFTRLCETDDITVSLDKYQGLVSVDQEKVQAVVKGGTKLRQLGDLLYREGMAMENLGDIDVQSIAGTICTGTHGTGTQFGTISTQVVGLRFINGRGEIVACSPTQQPELFRAAQVSLGSIGIITQVTLQCVPNYKLRLEMRSMPLEEVLSNLDELNASNRNFEYYWLPYTTKVAAKISNIAENEEVDKVNFFNYWSEYVMENYAFKVACEYARIFPSQNRAVSRLTANAMSNTSKVADSHKVYATPRLVKFREMEYNVPADAYQDVWAEIRQKINNSNFHVHFPIENRWVKEDDILMSPAYGRDSAYIACHVYYKKDCQAYFAALEEIFRAHGGRPQWGKMNTLTAADVADLYPMYPTFMKHRSEQDPDGLFVSPYVQQLLGISI